MFISIRLTLDILPFPLGASCFLLARGISFSYDLDYRDGWFNISQEHSWIVTPHNNIIDLYPMGIVGGPILLDIQSPWCLLYKEGADWSTKIAASNMIQLFKIIERVRKEQERILS